MNTRLLRLERDLKQALYEIFEEDKFCTPYSGIDTIDYDKMMGKVDELFDKAKRGVLGGGMSGEIYHSTDKGANSIDNITWCETP